MPESTNPFRITANTPKELLVRQLLEWTMNGTITWTGNATRLPSGIDISMPKATCIGCGSSFMEIDANMGYALQNAMNYSKLYKAVFATHENATTDLDGE